MTQLLAYIGGLGAALLLAFYLPSHLLSVREQMRAPVSEPKTVRTAAPIKESRATTGANPGEISDKSGEPERASERQVSAEQTLGASPPAPVSQSIEPPVPPADTRKVSVNRTLAASPAPISKPLDPPGTQAFTRNSEHNSKPKVPKRAVFTTQAKPQNQTASQTRIARVPPKRQESEITASLDGLEFWWKKPSKKEKRGERIEARYEDPTEFWWR